MEVKPAPVVEDYQDDISEPDEDSLAGQMALMKEGGLTGGGGGGGTAGVTGSGSKESKKSKSNESDSDSDDE